MAINLQTLEAAARTVSPELIGKAHKIIAATGDFYLVENERGDYNAQGLIEYKVDLVNHTCTCKAGEFGFTHCRNGYCKHLVWATAAQLEETQAMAEQAIAAATAILQASATNKRAHHLVIDGKVATEAEYDRIMNAQPRSTKHVPLNRQAGFNLMR